MQPYGATRSERAEFQEHVKDIPTVKMKDEDGNVMLDADGNERHVP